MKNSKLNITIGKHSGFCFGVKRAYDLACVNSRNCTDIFILGKLVHNDDVCRDLKKRGIREIESLASKKNGTVIFTAHGIGPKVYGMAQKRGLKVIDTTCPKVMKAQRLAENYARKHFRVIIFGDKNHKEVKSICEWSGNKAKIVSSFREAKSLKLARTKKYCLISQTTQNVQEFGKIKNYLVSQLPNLICFSTICDSTDNRQKEVRELSKSKDAVVVIGGRDSANSRRLFEIAKEINPKTYFIQNEKQVRDNWLAGIQSLAVTAGASTPNWVIRAVVEKIRNIF